MARLPDVDYSAPVERSSQTEALPGEAAQGLTKVLAEGLQQYSQALRESQQADAALSVSKGIDEASNILKKKRYLTAQEIRDTFDGNVPPEIQSKLQTLDATTGQMVDQPMIPTFDVGDALLAHAAKKLVDTAAQQISGQGWQTRFKQQIASHVLAKRQAMTAYNLQAMQDYLETGTKRRIAEFVNAGDFGSAAIEAKSQNLSAPDQITASAAVETAKQEYKAQTALLGNDPNEMAKQVTRLQTDPAAQAAIPQEKRDRLIAELQNRERVYRADGIAQRLVATKGAMNADGTINLSRLQGHVDQEVSDPILKHHIMENLGQRARVQAEQRDAVTSNAIASAMQAFTALDAAGKPMNTVTAVMARAPKAWAYLTSAASGEKGAAAVRTLEAWQRENENRIRDEYLKPTPAQARRAAEVEYWLYKNRSGLVKTQSFAEITSKWFDTAPGEEAFLAQPDVQRLGNTLGSMQVAGPEPAPITIRPPEAIIEDALKEAISAFRRPSSGLTTEQLTLRNEIFRRALQVWSESRDPEKLDKFIQEQLKSTSVKAAFGTTTVMPRIEAELKNREIVDPNVIPEPGDVRPKPTPMPNPAENFEPKVLRPRAGFAFVTDENGKRWIMPQNDPRLKQFPDSSIIMGPPAEKKP
jgi:hypothetical protein